MHVADKMEKILDVHRNGRVRKILIVLQKLYSFVNGRNCVTCFRIWRIHEVLVHPGHMPFGREGILRSMTVFIHPLGIVYDGVVSKVSLYYLSCRRLQVIVGDLGDGLMTLSSPAESRTAHEQSG